MVGNSNEYLTKLKENLETAINTVNPESATALTAKMAELQHELIDRTEKRENCDDLAEEILRLRKLQEKTVMDDTVKVEHKKRISEVTEFDELLVKKLLERVTVHDDYMEFRLKLGVTVSIEKRIYMSSPASLVIQWCGDFFGYRV